jgi:hypothetical protein
VLDELLRRQCNGVAIVDVDVDVVATWAALEDGLKLYLLVALCFLLNF